MKKGKIKSIIGTLAVLFSIQPLAAWAAGTKSAGAKSSASKSADRSSKSGPRGPVSRGAPICGV